MKKSRFRLAAVAMLAFAAMAVSHAQPICTSCGPVSSRPVRNLSLKADASGNLTALSTVLYCDTLYKLDKRIYVTDGKTLTIEAGTIIKADTNNIPATAKSVVVCQGGKIYAEGTESCPIIFTSNSDPLNGTKLLCDREEWGGLILLGKAQNNIRKTDKHSDGVTNVGYANFVGYIEGLPIPDVRHHYGLYPSDTLLPNRQFYNNDNSGVLRYVSIRFGGSIIGAANEINGLTMASVGSGTVIDHVEVVSNQDDAFEFFGGTVNAKNLIAVGHGDDAFDWDQGYTGKGQFLYAANLPGNLEATQGTHGLEIDGNDKDGRKPNSYGVFYNVTVIGNSVASNIGIEAKAETKGEVVNSLFANYATAGLKLTKTLTGTYYQQDSLKIKCNTFYNVPSANRVVIATTPLASWTIDQYQAKFDADGNVVVSSLDGFDATWEYATPCALTGKLDQAPDNITQVGVGNACAKPADEFFDYAPYRGAFNPNEEPWTKGWTYYSSIKTGVEDVLCPTDFNGDNITNSSDYYELLGKYGQSCQ